jgi:hypothetical protein
MVLMMHCTITGISITVKDGSCSAQTASPRDLDVSQPRFNTLAAVRDRLCDGEAEGLGHPAHRSAERTIHRGAAMIALFTAPPSCGMRGADLETPKQPGGNVW